MTGHSMSNFNSVIRISGSHHICEFGIFAIFGIGQTLAMDAKEQLKDDVRAERVSCSRNNCAHRGAA